MSTGSIISGNLYSVSFHARSGSFHSYESHTKMHSVQTLVIYPFWVQICIMRNKILTISILMRLENRRALVSWVIQKAERLFNQFDLLCLSVNRQKGSNNCKRYSTTNRVSYWMDVRFTVIAQFGGIGGLKSFIATSSLARHRRVTQVAKDPTIKLEHTKRTAEDMHKFIHSFCHIEKFGFLNMFPLHLSQSDHYIATSVSYQ